MKKIRTLLANKILKDSRFVMNVYNFYFRLLNKKRFLKEIARREHLDLFDYRNLSKELPYYPAEFHKDSNLYGYVASLKYYSNCNQFSFLIEHGLYYDQNYIPSSYSSKTIDKILTFGRKRALYLNEETGKTVIPIGPYIHYASPLLSSNDICQLKKSLGKTLLFFPIHSHVEAKVRYNIESVIEEVKKFFYDNNFNTVLVNMYYMDIETTDYASYYEKEGFKVVTAGHRYDPNFVRRLKTVISLSDFVITNGMGTNIGFCVYMNKPVYIIGKEESNGTSEIERDVYRLFSKFTETITQEQKELVEYYWGTDCIRKPEELNEILSE